MSVEDEDTSSPTQPICIIGSENNLVNIAISSIEHWPLFHNSIYKLIETAATCKCFSFV
jgi:hypothetical protein